MDFTRLSQGEKIAGVSGILLILFMFIFDWFGLKFELGRGALLVSAEGCAQCLGLLRLHGHRAVHHRPRRDRPRRRRGIRGRALDSRSP